MLELKILICLYRNGGERYKTFIHLGVDAVIGMHPHVPQGWELIDGKPIFYSLGNFYFDMHSDNPSIL